MKPIMLLLRQLSLDLHELVDPPPVEELLVEGDGRGAKGPVVKILGQEHGNQIRGGGKPIVDGPQDGLAILEPHAAIIKG